MTKRIKTNEQALAFVLRSHPISEASALYTFLQRAAQSADKARRGLENKVEELADLSAKELEYLQNHREYHGSFFRIHASELINKISELNNQISSDQYRFKDLILCAMGAPAMETYRAFWGEE